MIVAAAVCPGPPLLVPGLAPRLAQAVPDLVAASRAAVASLASTGRIVVVTTGFRGTGPSARGPGSLITSSSLARGDVAVAANVVLPRGTGATVTEHWAASWGEADPRGAAAPGTVVAAHLVTGAGVTAPTSAVEVDPTLPDPSGQVRALVPEVDDDVPTGLLVIADGAAAHGADAPAAGDPAAAEFDQSLLTILGEADPVALAAFCRDRAAQAAVLRCESLPAWAALADLTPGRPPTAGLIDYYGAPFGVGYLVAEWQWRSTD